MAANDSDGIGEKLRESFRSAVEADRMRRDLKTALRSGAEEKQMVGGETDGVEEALAALAEKFPDKDRDELLELVDGGDLAGGGAEDVDFEMEGQQGDPASFAGTEKAGATDRVGPGMADEKQGEWEQYEGPEGGRGWRHTRTGEVRYQEEKPEPEPGDGEAGPEEPAEDPVAAATDEMDEHSVLAAMEIAGISQGSGGDEEAVEEAVEQYRSISGDEETDRGTVEAVMEALVMPEEEVEGTREEEMERIMRESADAGGTGVGGGAEHTGTGDEAGGPGERLAGAIGDDLPMAWGAATLRPDEEMPDDPAEAAVDIAANNPSMAEDYLYDDLAREEADEYMAADQQAAEEGKVGEFHNALMDELSDRGIPEPMMEGFDNLSLAVQMAPGAVDAARERTLGGGEGPMADFARAMGDDLQNAWGITLRPDEEMPDDPVEAATEIAAAEPTMVADYLSDQIEGRGQEAYRSADQQAAEQGKVGEFHEALMEELSEEGIPEPMMEGFDALEVSAGLAPEAVERARERTLGDGDPSQKAAEYIERQRRVLDRDSLSGGLGEAFKGRLGDEGDEDPFESVSRRLREKLGLAEKQGEWEPYEGPRGGSGWRHAGTGEVRYQEEKPAGGAPGGGGGAPGGGGGAPGGGGGASRLLEEYEEIMSAVDQDEVDIRDKNFITGGLAEAFGTGEVFDWDPEARRIRSEVTYGEKTIEEALPELREILSDEEWDTFTETAVKRAVVWPARKRMWSLDRETVDEVYNDVVGGDEDDRLRQVKEVVGALDHEDRKELLVRGAEEFFSGYLPDVGRFDASSDVSDVLDEVGRSRFDSAVTHLGAGTTDRMIGAVEEYDDYAEAVEATLSDRQIREVYERLGIGEGVDDKLRRSVRGAFAARGGGGE